MFSFISLILLHLLYTHRGEPFWVYVKGGFAFMVMMMITRVLFKKESLEYEEEEVEGFFVLNNIFSVLLNFKAVTWRR
jgi:phosphotransferase system  glucose/maltose/N-acetylglucosamine-specific IIC component